MVRNGHRATTNVLTANRSTFSRWPSVLFRTFLRDLLHVCCVICMHLRSTEFSQSILHLLHPSFVLGFIYLWFEASPLLTRSRLCIIIKSAMMRQSPMFKMIDSEMLYVVGISAVGAASIAYIFFGPSPTYTKQLKSSRNGKHCQC